MQQRTAAPRPARRLPGWVTDPRLAALLALAAECGHLGLAWLVWPDSVARGVVHVVAAGVLGLIGVNVYFGQSRSWISLGCVLVLACSWPVVHWPLPIGIGVTATEVALVLALAARLRR